MNTVTVKPAISRLPEYHVPQPSGIIKLNQNESPWDIPSDIKADICRRLSLLPWNRYPSDGAPALREKLSSYTGHPPEGILTGNGSNELIQTLITAFCRRQDRVLTVSPGFSVYGRVAESQNIRTEEVSLEESFRFDLHRISQASQQCRIAFLPSPNNPTGTWMTEEEIAGLAASSPTLFVIDEAYTEFSGSTARVLLSRFQNLVVLRTFSKAAGLAGFRLGYLLGTPEMVRDMKKAQLPFSVGAAQQAAGEVLLEHTDVIQERANSVVRERDRLQRELGQFPGIRPIPSRANFILFRTTRLPGKALFQRLFEKGVLVRQFESPQLRNYLRVTVGQSSENTIFLERLASILSEREER